MLTAAMKLKDTCFLRAMTNLESILKSRDITLLTKLCIVNAVSSSSHMWMWGLHRKEGWVLKNWCFWAVVLEKTLESPLDCKEIKPVHPKGNQPWIFNPEGLMLKLKLQYFGHLMWRTDSLKRPWCWEWLKVGGEGDGREWDGWLASPSQWT